MSVSRSRRRADTERKCGSRDRLHRDEFGRREPRGGDMQV